MLKERPELLTEKQRNTTKIRMVSFLLLMSVLHGPLGYASPAVATEIARGPAHGELNGDDPLRSPRPEVYV